MSKELDKDLLKILACPKCKGDLDYKKDKEVLDCKNCQLLFKVTNCVPNMLIDEAISY